MAIELHDRLGGAGVLVVALEAAAVGVGALPLALPVQTEEVEAAVLDEGPPGAEVEDVAVRWGRLAKARSAGLGLGLQVVARLAWAISIGLNSEPGGL